MFFVYTFVVFSVKGHSGLPRTFSATVGKHRIQVNAIRRYPVLGLWVKSKEKQYGLLKIQ